MPWLEYCSIFQKRLHIIKTSHRREIVIRDDTDILPSSEGVILCGFPPINPQIGITLLCRTKSTSILNIL